MTHIKRLVFFAMLGLFSCNRNASTELPVAEKLASSKHDSAATSVPVKPLFVSEPVKHDTDDPAIWINYENPSESLILGTDKEVDGALYVFDLEGKIVEDKVIRNLKRPNNVDVEYGLKLEGEETDIAVTTERLSSRLRVFSLPDMKPIDGGGLEVFEGESGPEYRDLMGVALYKRPADGAVFAIVGRKNGPQDGTYLWQYRLEDDNSGKVKASLVRKFGNFSGKKEIEAIAVDDQLGYVYYSDEGVGLRKYYADPEKGNEELALFATEGFQQDHEGISVLQKEGGKGYLLVSDQEVNKFWIFTREGYGEDPHDHKLVKVVEVSTTSSDGSEVVNFPLPPHFPNGLFVAMSDDKTFHLYRLEDIVGDSLKIEVF